MLQSDVPGVEELDSVYFCIRAIILYSGQADCCMLLEVGVFDVGNTLH